MKKKYALKNTMLGFICGKVKKDKTDYGFSFGRKPKYYRTLKKAEKAHAKLSTLQRMLISVVEI